MQSLNIVPFMMALDDFWGRIDDAKMIADAHEMPLHEALALRLVVDPPAGVESFQERFWELHIAARRRDIHNVLGGTDDGFGDNIGCVISMGRQAYEKLIADPDSFDRIVWEYELFAPSMDDALDGTFRGKHLNRARSLLELAILGEFIPNSKAKSDSLRI